MDSIEWFYVDIDGESKGPITTNELKQLPLDVFVWNGTTVNYWTELKDIQSLLHNDNKHEQYENHTDNTNYNANTKPKLENYWSISNKMNSINIGSQSHTITDFQENDFDYTKFSIQKNENTLKSNLQKELQNNAIRINNYKQQQKRKTIRAKIKIIKQSVTEPPTFSADDVINDKFEKILNELQIAERARHAMREWTEDKKLQMILQYDFKHKSEMLNKKKKTNNITKKGKKLFKRNSKKKKSLSKKQNNNKQWTFGFNPLPIPKDEKSDNYNGNTVENCIQTTVKSVSNSSEKQIESITEFNRKNNINNSCENQENIYFSAESTKPNNIFSISKDNNIDYSECTNNSIVQPVIFSIVNEKENNYTCNGSIDTNTLSIQHDYLSIIDQTNEMSSGIEDDMNHEND